MKFCPTDFPASGLVGKQSEPVYIYRRSVFCSQMFRCLRLMHQTITVLRHVLNNTLVLLH
jgi:hypothetical protein